MKLRVKTVVEITLDVRKDYYPVNAKPAKILEIEKEQYFENLMHIIYDDDVKFTNTITLLEDNNLPMGEIHWVEKGGE
jgi:hypothetical protein